MGSISVQFHALPSEMAGLAADLLGDPEIFLTEAVGQPLRFAQRNNHTRNIEGLETIRALLFTIGEPRLDARDLYEFRKFNPDGLVLEIGRLTDRGLEESWLSAETDDEAALERWRRASRALKSGMLTGAEAVSNSNGSRGPMKWHRFTKGVLHMYKDGLRILPVVGETTIHLPVDT